MRTRSNAKCQTCGHAQKQHRAMKHNCYAVDYPGGKMSACACLQFVRKPMEPLPPGTITAAFIKKVLKEKYASPGWAFLLELRLGTGYGDAANRYMDAFAMSMWGGLETIVFEIKISRSDFAHEIKSPSKRRQALAFANQFFFVTPAGMLSKDEVPKDSGLIEVQVDGTLETVINAPTMERIRPTWRFVASVARRIAGDLV